MNQRIRELTEQAREYATTRHRVSNIVLSINNDKFEQRFAELLVKEFAQLVEDNIDPQNAWITPGSVKQHFGVEE